MNYDGVQGGTEGAQRGHHDKGTTRVFLHPMYIAAIGKILAWLAGNASMRKKENYSKAATC